VSGASGASGVSSRRAKRGGASPAAASPRWWDVKARLETALRRDERSEFGYLEHDSEGETVFRERSSLNGDVHVVKHGPWRSLRFNEVEQGLSYVRETRDEATGEVLRVTADADVLGYEYLRCMTAAAAAMCRLDVGADWTKVDGVEEKKNASRVVCVGLGSGAMPAFIANAFPELLVEVVEIDDVVVDAAEKALGLPGIRTRRAEEPEETTDKKAGVEPEPEPQSGRQKSLGNLRVVIGDASAFMASAAAAVRRGEASAARAIFLDAFDGEGETPPRLTSSAFLRDCAACVAPGGVVVANCFNGVRGSKARHGAESFAVALSR
jgi:tRNA G46 methylase TrmB